MLLDGVPESVNESWADCEKKVKGILEKDMKLDNVKNIKFVRCHRLGPKRHTNKPRTVIFKLHWYKDRELIWSKKTHLKDTPYWLKEDFPSEIVKRRSILQPIVQAARKLDMTASLKVDKLVLDGRTYTVDTVHQLPDHLNPANLATKTENGITAFFRQASPLSMFHPCQIKDPDTGTVYHSGEQWLQAGKAAEFGDKDTVSDIMQANTAFDCYKLGQNVKNFTVDGWYKNGKAKELMKKINIAKYHQHPKLLTFLKKTAPVIAEANPKDSRWGIALPISDRRTFNKEQWQGSNWLGEVLMHVKSIL